MKTVSISGSPRVSVGKKDAKALRREGKVPCVLYGGGQHIHFSSLEKDFGKIVYSAEAHMVNLDLDGKQVNALLQEIQFHKISDKILHVDFLEVIPGKPVVLNLPVKVEGNPTGVKAGGKLHKKMRTVKVKGMPDKFPEALVLNVESMEIGDTISISDLKGDGLQFLDAPNVTVVSVRVTRAVVEEVKPVAATAAAAPAAASGTAPAAGAPAAAPKKAEGKK